MSGWSTNSDLRYDTTQLMRMRGKIAKSNIKARYVVIGTGKYQEDGFTLVGYVKNKEVARGISIELNRRSNIRNWNIFYNYKKVKEIMLEGE